MTRNDAKGGEVSEFCDVNELNHYTDILLPNLLHGGFRLITSLVYLNISV